MRNAGVPVEAMSRLPEISPSFIVSPPAKRCHVTLMSPRPAALACFSISLPWSISVNVRYVRPGWTAMRSSFASARAGAGRTAAAEASPRRPTGTAKPRRIETSTANAWRLSGRNLKQTFSHNRMKVGQRPVLRHPPLGLV